MAPATTRRTFFQAAATTTTTSSARRGRRRCNGTRSRPAAPPGSRAGSPSTARCTRSNTTSCSPPSRAGKPINDGEASAHSTLMAILGRQAAYTGQRLTWKQMLKSKESLVPETLAWGPAPAAEVAMPGKTKFR